MREKIKLVSSAKTGHYYTTTKNKKEHPDKMETKKIGRAQSELQSHSDLVCRLLLEKKKKQQTQKAPIHG